jgi:minichromosome maintenance protein 10
LLSTPGGRDRLRRLANRTSPSPSPIKKSYSNPALLNEARAILRPTTALDGLDTEDDEDEETLQLQLQEIQARLKLKKLQKAKARDALPVSNEQVQKEATLLVRASSAAAVRSRQDVQESQRQRLQVSKSQERIHVPVSPSRKIQAAEAPISPKRVLLGIDKGLKGSDVSLRRPPSRLNASGDNATDGRRTGPYLQRSNSQAGNHGPVGSRSQSSSDVSRHRTFSERMADIRTQEADQREMDARIKRTRSTAFDIDAKELDNYKEAAAALPETTIRAPEFSRDQIINAYNKPIGGLLQRSKSTSSMSSKNQTIDGSRTTTMSTTVDSQTSSRVKKKALRKEEQAASSEFESFSSLHLSKRIIPHNVLTRTLSGKKTYTIPELFKVVVSPHWRLPDVEEDIVLLAVIASRSEPKVHKAKATNDERGKYMVMTLTDLKWELQLFLFNSGFDKFWKLDPGTIIAILNPNIMPPMHADTGRFSLTLNSSEDTVLELGTARDLGFCKAAKKDGKTCDAWIDKRHTEICEFHVNEALKKTMAGRMEVNSMNFGKKRGTGSGTYGARKFNSKDMTGYEKPKKESIRYDREAGKVYIAAPPKGNNNTPFIGGPGRSAAALLDDMDVDLDAFHRGSSKEERMRRQLAATEKERETARKLGAVGGGLGADYMRLRDQRLPASSDIDQPFEPPPDATTLALLGSKSNEVHLSPIKRKRADTSSTSTPMGSAARGWGSQLTKELARMKDGERLQPVKKKTRFVTEKGIREAGRESFGGDAAPLPPADNNDDDDDDDDLDIVR